MIKSNKGGAGERGQILIVVMVLLVLGSFLMLPLLTLAGTGLKASIVYEKKTSEIYSADAGLKDATWQIKYDQLETLFPTYNAYDYGTAWNYNLPNQVNGRNVAVTIENIWVPANISAPDKTQAIEIIAAQKLIVTGEATGTTWKIKITYTPGPDEDLRVQTLGIWLPRGFNYIAGSSNLEDDPNAAYYAVPTTETHAGNQAVLWTFSSVPFVSFPDVDPETSPMVTEVNFQFTSSEPGAKPNAIASVTTSGVDDIPFSWDADSKVFKITSQANDTTIESYIAKEELRSLSGAVSGDYVAIGNSLMIDTNHDSSGIRDQLLSISDATTNIIPLDAGLGAAFLYWSGWRKESSKQTVFSDSCSNLNNWTAGSGWQSSSGRFRGYYSGGQEPPRYLTLTNNLNLSTFSPGTVTVSWEHWESGTLESNDGLDFAVSGDGGSTWGSNIQVFRDDIGSSAIRYTYIIPSQYLSSTFKLRFYLQGFADSSEYCYIDNISVAVNAPDTLGIFKVDGTQVYYDGGGQPAVGAQPISADSYQVSPAFDTGGNPNGFSYACFKDVTSLVRTFSAKAPDPATNHPGNGTYAVGEVLGDTGEHWSYAAWSLIFIYSTAETQGHQLYLYDKFTYANSYSNIDFDNDGQPGGYVSGFIVPEQVFGEVNAAKLTVFIGEGDECWTGETIKFNGTALSNAQSPWNNVWNSKSPGLSNDGIDIDTFDITWASGLLGVGDTSAQIDMQTQLDAWNLIYMILSFRTEATVGGSLSYVIK